MTFTLDYVSMAEITRACQSRSGGVGDPFHLLRLVDGQAVEDEDS